MRYLALGDSYTISESVDPFASFQIYRSLLRREP
jgi:hypothetical protein